MKKIGFLILFTLIVQGCNSQSPTEETEHTSIPAIQTGAMQVEETRPDDPNLPNCEPLDLKPLSPEEIIKIDDVVQNCKYESGHIVYNDTIGKAGVLFAKIKIRKNFITWEDDRNTNIACEYLGQNYAVINPYDTPSGSLDENKQTFLNFLKKHKLQEKQLLTLTSELHSLLGNDEVISHYGCKEKKLCHKLLPKTFSDNNNHYFLYAHDFPENILIIDDKRYLLGQIKYNNTIPLIIEQGPWIPINLQGNKLIVNRFLNGKLTNSDKKHYKKGETMGTFQLETCEIPLIEKTP